MQSILLVRHAETTLNATRTVQFPDTPLSDRGEWQARRLALRLKQDGITHVATSDYARAQATARTICHATQARLTINPILRERDLGALRGRSYAEVEDFVFSETVDPEAGERWPDFVDRIDRLWEWVGEQSSVIPGAFAVITHGLVCRGIALRHLTLPATDTPARFPNASVTVIEPQPPWRVSLIASESHLL